MAGTAHSAIIFLVLTLFFNEPSFLLGDESEKTGPPMINIEGKQMTVNSNKTFHLFCRSYKPIQWRMPKGPGIGERTKIVTTNEMNEHRSNLTIENAVYTDTGLYECVFSQSDNINKNTSDSVYVYVNSEDPGEMFLPLPNFPQLYEAYSEEIFILPCRVTHPNMSVTLHNFWGKISDEENIEYDPEEGFVIHNPPPTLRGRVSCEANHEDNSQRKYLLVRWHARQETPHPRIIGVNDEREEIFVGDNFKIDCIADIPLATVITLDWIIPVLKTNNSKSSVDITPTSREVQEQTGNYREMKTTLSLKNAQLEDSGKYVCKASNRKGSNDVSIHIDVLEQGYIIITAPEKNSLQVKEGEKRRRINFKVKSNPEANWKWYKNGERITSENQTFTITSKKRGGNSRVLTISKVSEVHAGNYTLVGENKYTKREKTVFLDVLVAPQITISIDENKYTNLEEDSYFNSADIYIDREEGRTIKCAASGNPIPKVSWKWLQCVTSSNCTQTFMKALKIESWTDVDNSSNHAVFQRKDNESILELTPPLNTGWYLCLAKSNVYDTVKQEVPFMITDVENGFDLKMKSLTSPVNGDNVTLICSANKFTHRGQIQWYTEDHLIQSNGDAYVLNEFENVFSYVSELTILEIDGEQQDFTCSVNSMDGKKQQENEKFIVQAIESPIMDFKEISKEIHKKDGVLSMECKATGLPRPTIKWFKHDKVVDYKTPGMKMREEGEKTVVSTFEIHRLQVSDTGNYKCEATNRGGSVSQSTYMEVLEMPQLEVDDNLMKVNIGDNATLQCYITAGKPEPNITWKKVGSEIDSSVIPDNHLIVEGNKLFIHNVKTSDLGTYRCIASNKINSTSEDIILELVGSSSQNILGVDLTSSKFIVIFCISGVFALVLVILIVLLSTKLKKERQRILDIKGDILMMPLTTDDFAELERAISDMDYDSKWEFPRDRLNLGTTIGKGAYGRVIKASAVGIEKSKSISTVAVKMLKEDAAESERKALFTELKILIMIGHHINILNLLGAVTKGDLMIIVEFCRYGNLAEYLKARRDDFGKEPAASGYSKNIKSTKYSVEQLDVAPFNDDKNIVFDYKEEALCLQDLICYSYQVARGMEYLHSRRCIHRDLAARNVLLTDNNVVKICDFGLARDVYTDPNYVTRGGYRLPIKWMAPESIFDEKVFTQMTDTWSFGIFLWEVFSLGMSPYPGLAIDEDFYDKLRSGFRMGCPQQAPHDMYLTILDCWHTEPEERPSFTELMDRLGNQLEETYKHEYIDLNTSKEENDEPMENHPLMAKETLLQKEDDLNPSLAEIDMYANQEAIEMQQLRRSNGYPITYLDMSKTGGFNRTDKNYMSMKDNSEAAIYKNINVTENPLNSGRTEQERLSTNPFITDLPERRVAENSIGRNRLSSSPYDQNIKGGFLQARLNSVGSIGKKDGQSNRNSSNNFSSKVNNGSDESMASDTSSGFHSDGLPSPITEDPPISYNPLMHHVTLANDSTAV